MATTRPRPVSPNADEPDLDGDDLVEDGEEVFESETYVLDLKLTGTTPLLVKNPERLANPTDPATKQLAALNGKQRKTDEDYHEIARIEFVLSLYYADDIGPYLPIRNVVGMLAESGSFYKIKAPILRSFLIFDDPRVPIQYKGPRDIESMLRTGSKFVFTRPVVLKQGGRKSSVLRTHPRFDQWGLECEIGFDSQEVPQEKLELALKRADRVGSIGDFRPSYGRFDLEYLFKDYQED